MDGERKTVTVSAEEYRRMNDISDAANRVWGYMSAMRAGTKRTAAELRRFADYAQATLAPAVEVRP